MNNNLILYSVIGPYGFMTIKYTQKDLFNLDSHNWDSIQRYLMYKKFENSPKGEMIKKIESLDAAIEIYNLKNIFDDTSPKSLIENKEMEGVIHSQTCENFDDKLYDYLRDANIAKFKNPILKDKLKKTSGNIVNKNFYDEFGYIGNLLGNILMEIRDGISSEKKHNNIVLKTIDGVCVLQGDPDARVSKKINGKYSYKYNGWCIIDTHVPSMKKLVLETAPDYVQLQKACYKWIKKFAKRILKNAIVIAKYLKHLEITESVLLFSINNIYGFNFTPTENMQLPNEKFKKMVKKIIESEKFNISVPALLVLWNFSTKLSFDNFKNIDTIEDFNQIIKVYNEKLLTEFNYTNKNLTENEELFVNVFKKLYGMIYKNTKSISTIIQIISGRKHYEHIKKLFNNNQKIKLIHEIQLINTLPKMNEKCTKLVLIAIEHLLNLPKDEKIKFIKKLLMKQKTPTIFQNIYEKDEDKNDEKDEDKNDEKDEEKNDEKDEDKNDEKDEEKNDEKDEEKDDEKDELLTNLINNEKGIEKNENLS